MNGIASSLEEWRKAGLITAQQVKAVEAYEKGKAGLAPPGQGRAAPVAEALGYVGGAIAISAVGILLGDRWDDLNVGGRLTVVCLVTLVLAGAALTLRRNTQAPVQRLVSVLAVGTIAGIAWLTTTVLGEWTNWRGRDIGLFVSTVVFILGAALYLVRRRALPQLVTLVSLLVMLGTLFARPVFAGGHSWGALVTWAVGIAWVLLAIGGWHKPRELGIAAGSITAIIGASEAAGPEEYRAFLWLGLVTAGALLWRGVTSNETLLVVVGAVGVLLFVPWLITWLFPEGTAMVVAMLAAGLLLVLVAVWIARGRRVATKEARS